MKKVVIVAAVVILIVLFAGTYYYFSGKKYVVRLTESDLQSKLEENLLLTKTYFFIIQVTLNNPRVHLKNGSSKVDAGLDDIFNITLNKHSKPLGGSVDVSGGILYLAKKGQFFLTDPVIENLTVQGIAPKYIRNAKNALTKALAEYYKNNPIYTLRVIDAKQVVAKMVLKSVIIENKELLVTLGI